MGCLVNRSAVSVALGYTIFSSGEMFDCVVPEHHLDFERKRTRLLLTRRPHYQRISGRRYKFYRLAENLLRRSDFVLAFAAKIRHLREHTRVPQKLTPSSGRASVHQFKRDSSRADEVRGLVGLDGFNKHYDSFNGGKCLLSRKAAL